MRNVLEGEIQRRNTRSALKRTSYGSGDLKQESERIEAEMKQNIYVQLSMVNRDGSEHVADLWTFLDGYLIH